MAVDAVNLAEHAGHWSHVTALSVSVKCAEIPGRVGDCPPPGPGHPGSGQKQIKINFLLQIFTNFQYKPAFRLI